MGDFGREGASDTTRDVAFVREADDEQEDDVDNDTAADEDTADTNGDTLTALLSRFRVAALAGVEAVAAERFEVDLADAELIAAEPARALDAVAPLAVVVAVVAPTPLDVAVVPSPSSLRNATRNHDCPSRAARG